MRSFLRKVLQLPSDTPIGAFHAPVKEGGLGVGAFTLMESTLTSVAYERLSDLEDPLVSEIANQERI